MEDKKELEIRCYCTNLRYVSNTLTKYYDRAFASIQITANQFFLLYVIRFLGSCNKSELARHTRLERTTVIRDLTTLLKKGLIEQVSGPTKRNQLIRLTSCGDETERKGKEIWEKLQEEVERMLGREHLEVFNALAVRMEELETLSER